MLQAFFGTFSANTLGSDLAAAAASLHISTIFTRVDIAHSIGSPSVVELITLALGVLWCICLRLAKPSKMSSGSHFAPPAKAGLPHLLAFLLGLLALYVASWIAAALQIAQANLKVIP
jgi:hypothetical protein